MLKSPKTTNETNVCRFCLETDSTTNMITPCDCRGSCAFVHRDCLRQWLDNSDTCNICDSKYHSSSLSVKQLTEALVSHFGNDVIYLVVLIVSYVSFVCSALIHSYKVDHDSQLSKWDNIKKSLDYAVITLAFIIIYLVI